MAQVKGETLYRDETGLIRPAGRADGDRRFAYRDLRKLALIGRVRALCFSIVGCCGLPAPHGDAGRSGAQVKPIARGHLDEIDAGLRDLTELRAMPANLIVPCAQGQRPDCPILDTLADPPATGRSGITHGPVTQMRLDRPGRLAPLSGHQEGGLSCDIF